MMPSWSLSCPRTRRTNAWIDQKIGYAVAKGIPVLPLRDEDVSRCGYIGDVEGVTIDRDNPSFTGGHGDCHWLDPVDEADSW